MVCKRCSHSQDIHLREQIVEPKTEQKKEKVSYVHTVCQALWCECRKWEEP